jgi:hypothetical protein
MINRQNYNKMAMKDAAVIVQQINSSRNEGDNSLFNNAKNSHRRYVQNPT